MADSKLSALTALAVEPDATDQLYVNDGGVSKRIAYSVLEAAICDTANVTAAGALMDSEVTNLAAVKAFDPADYATAAQGTTADSALQNVVEDTTPQLGGSLDVNGNKIVSASNGNIDIEPNGTGNVLLGNFTFDADQTVGAGQDNYVLTYDNGTGLISLEAAAGGGSGDFLADGTVDMTGQFKTDVGTFASDVANGASAVGFLFNTTNAYSTSGAKLLSLRNNGTEYFSVDKDGNIRPSGVSSGGTSIYFHATQNARVTQASGALQLHPNSGSSWVVNNGSASPTAGSHALGNNGIYFQKGADDGATVELFAGQETTDKQTAPITLKAGSAWTSATTNVNGANAIIQGGASASGSGNGGDVILTPGTGASANGSVRFGTHSAIGAESVTGYIEIKDASGTVRKLAVVS